MVELCSFDKFLIYNNFSTLSQLKVKNQSLRAGFEPAREYPIGFRVQRLNHSTITALRNIFNHGRPNLVEKTSSVK